MGGINICILLLNIKKKITIFLKVYEDKFRIMKRLIKINASMNVISYS